MKYIYYSLFLILYSCETESKAEINKETSINKCFCSSQKKITNLAAIEGYTNKISYSVGDTVSVFVHTISPSFDLELQIQSIESKSVFKIKNITGKKQNYNECSYRNGANWKKSYSFIIPNEIEPCYATINLTAANKEFKIPIIIKNNNNVKDILCIASTNTWHAYSPWGNASFYKIDSCSKLHFTMLSTKRPLTHIVSNLNYEGHLFDAELGLIHWLERENYNYDIITDTDLNFDSTILQNYKVVLLNTHSEYWTEKSLNNLDNYLDNKGNLMYVSANGLYWKVTLKNNQIECQKTAINHIHDGTLGGQWGSGNLNRSEAKTIGVAYNRAGYNTFTSYMVYNDKHWIFKNTKLKNGSLFGKSLNRGFASGHETDKRTPSSPSNTILLARGLNQEAVDLLDSTNADRSGGAEMVYIERENGAKIFSTGSITSGGSPLIDTSMNQIFHNVLENFLKSKK